MTYTAYLDELVKLNMAGDPRLHEHALDIGNILKTEGAGIIESIRNDNTISADLKRVVALYEGMRAFKRRIVALNVFSTVFQNVPLRKSGGLNKVAVPYFPLDTTPSKDHDEAEGYVFDQNTATESVEITINKRKYKPFNFYSHELARQPFLNTTQLMEMKAEQLSLDVWNDVMSDITKANFPNVALVDVPEGFDSNDVVTIGGACDDGDWPDVGRSLVLGTQYHNYLLKDPAMKDKSQSGSSDALREGSTGRVDRFDIFHCGRIPGNNEHLQGFATLKSSIGIATAPIEPGPGVLKQLVRYNLIIDPDTGIAFEYRYWGDADKDEDREVVEVNYGKKKIEPAALMRIVSQE